MLNSVAWRRWSVGLSCIISVGILAAAEPEKLPFDAKYLLEVELKGGILSRLALPELLVTDEYPSSLVIVDDRMERIASQSMVDGGTRKALYAVAPADGRYKIYVIPGRNENLNYQWDEGKYPTKDFNSLKVKVKNGADVYEDYDKFLWQLQLNELNSIRNQIRYNSSRLQVNLLAYTFPLSFTKYNFYNVARRNNMDKIAPTRRGGNFQQLRKTFQVWKNYSEPGKNNFPLYDGSIKNQQDYYWESLMRHVNNLEEVTSEAYLIKRWAEVEQNVTQKLQNYNRGRFNWIKNDHRIMLLHPEKSDVQSTTELLLNLFNDAQFPQAVLYQAKFNAENEGDYDFMVACNDNFELLVDGKTVVQNDDYRNHLPGQVRTFNGTASLKAGNHEVMLQLVRSGRNELPEFFWRPSGRDKFNYFENLSNDSRQQMKLAAFQDESGHSVPLLKINSIQIFFYGKHRRLAFITLQNALNDKEFRVEFQQRQYRSQNGKILLGYEFDNNKFAPEKIKVGWADSAELHPLTAGGLHERSFYLKNEIMPLDVETKSWQPFFVYNDEQLTITYEVNSGVALPLDLVLSVKSRNSALAGEWDGQVLKLESRGLATAFGNSLQRCVRKIDAPLNGARLSDGESVEVNAAWGEVKLESRKMNFMTLPQILRQSPEIATGVDSFEVAGEPLTVVLPRPTLDELRKFETFRLMLKPLRLHTIFVVGEISTDEILNQLPGRYEVRGQYPNLEIGEKADPAFLLNLPDLWQKVYRSDADVLLLKFPGPAERGIYSWRENLRAVASVLNAALYNESLQEVILLFDDTLEKISENESAQLRRLARDYNISLHFVSNLLKKQN